MDYRVNGDSKQINIYGHNSRTYNLPFRKLEKYLDEKFFNEHNMIYLQTDKRTRKYEIFSIKEIKTDFEHMNIDISKKEFAKHIEKLKKDSIYETNIDYNNESNILVLQTCSYNNKDSYYIISAIER